MDPYTKEKLNQVEELDLMVKKLIDRVDALTTKTKPLDTCTSCSKVLLHCVCKSNELKK